MGHRSSVWAARFLAASARERKVPGRAGWRAAMLETLERRVLLSVSGASLAGPTAVGTQRVYDTTVGATAGQSTGTLTQTIAGTGSFNGQSGLLKTNIMTVYNVVATDTTPAHTIVTSGASYTTVDSRGVLEYGSAITLSDGSINTQTNSPASVDLPPSMDLGVVYTTHFAITQSVTAPDGDGTPITSQETAQVVLLSDTLKSVTVEAGTFQVYELQTTITTTSSDGTSSTGPSTFVYAAPGVGFIEDSGSMDMSHPALELKSFTGKGTVTFEQQPADANAGAKLAPVTVAIRDAAGNIDTSSTAAVTLTLDVGNGNPAAKLGGTVTVNAVAGIATFSNLTVDKGGSYTLSASEDGLDATSAAFTVAADHFVFTKQPKSTDVGAPILFTVTAETALNKVDTTFSGAVQIGFNKVTGGANATLGGVTSLTLVKGVATFAGANAPKISAPGTYTLTASDVGSNGDATGTSTPIDIAGLHLVFTKSPVEGDIKAPLLFTVTAENSKNKIDKTVNGEVTVSLNVLSGGANATLRGTTTVALVNGVATYTAATDDNVAIPGMYTLTASGGTGAVAGLRPAVVETNPFLAGVSRTFAIDGFQLVVKGPAKQVSVNTFLPMVVGLFDKKHKLVTADDGNFVDVSQVTQIVGTHSTDHAFYVVQAEPLEGGIATFTVDQGLIFKDVGTFALRVTEYDSINAEGAPINPVSVTNDDFSNPFQVIGLHLKFIEQPTFQFVNEPITFTVGLYDFKNNLVTKPTTDVVDITHIFTFQGSVDAQTNGPTGEIIDGIATFGVNPPTTIDAAGTYGITVSALTTVGATTDLDVLDPTTKETTSKIFRISAG